MTDRDHLPADELLNVERQLELAGGELRIFVERSSSPRLIHIDAEDGFSSINSVEARTLRDWLNKVIP